MVSSDSPMHRLLPQGTSERELRYPVRRVPETYYQENDVLESWLTIAGQNLTIRSRAFEQFEDGRAAALQGLTRFPSLPLLPLFSALLILCNLILGHGVGRPCFRRELPEPNAEGEL